MTRNRVLSAVALTASVAMLAACGGGDGGTTGAEGSENGETTLTWWHNGSQEPLKGYWQGLADEFMAQNEGVTINVEAIQNEDLETRLQVAIQSGDAPEVFQQWGGGEMADQVAAGALMDLTDKIPDAIEEFGGAVAGWQTEGKTYGLPYNLGVGGFWYNTAMFEEAGISEPPTDMDSFFEAIDKLKAAGIAPIAVGAGDKWPAAWYYYYAATRVCSADALETAQLEFDFSDPCFVEAGELVQSIIDTEPFNEGFLATPAQTGATSSAGLLANRQAAMELMGHWNPGVMEGLTEDQKGLGEDLGWFPFPEVEGAPGNDALMGGGDGFSCSAEAPDICADFVAFLVNEENQRAFAPTNAGLPAHPAASEAVEDPNLQKLVEVRDNAERVVLYLDKVYGPNVGNALNDAVALQFAGQADAQDIVDAMTQAAETR